MKPKFLLLASMALLSTAVQARDIHGVKGYYNYTAAQLQQDGLCRVDGGTGNKDKNWLPAVNFNDGYVESVLGVGDASKNWWRMTTYLNYRAQDQNLKITKNYPVVAFKFSLPKNVNEEAINMTIEHWWKKPYDGKYSTMTYENGLGINGVGSNGRNEWATMWRGKKITNSKAGLMVDRDSCKMAGDNKYDKWLTNQDEGIAYMMRTGNYGTAASKDTSAVVMRLPDSAPDKDEFVLLLNYYSIADNSDEAKESKRLLDRMDIESVGYHIMFFGYSNVEDAIEAPTAYIKWMKTFTSVQDAMDKITLANNYGDGTESVAKTQLNYSLYYAEQALAGFKYLNSDVDVVDNEAYKAYKEAYNAANEVYNSGSSSDADCANANSNLQAARVAFNQQVDLPSGLVYNYLKSATGQGAIIVGNDDVTIGGTIGKPLTIGNADAAQALSFVATGQVVNGQKSYNLKSATGAVMQASDGTLLLVEGATGSPFTFSKRDNEGNAFDIHCGDYYYYLDGDGQLAKEKEITSDVAEDFEALSAYLFTVDDAIGDYQKNASAEEKIGLDLGWEFNDAPEEDPGTRGMIDGEEKVMSENSETKMVSHWRMSRWRAFSRVNQETVKNSDGTDATCLVLSTAPTYDNWDASQTGIVNDYSAPAAMRLDHGTETPFYVRDPNPRDDAYAYNINAGINRYFAIKMTHGDAEFNTMTFIGQGLDITINLENATGKKGDVLYWDLLQNGFAVGKNTFTSAFFSPKGFTQANTKLYVDWMRTYPTIEDIPEESFAEGVASGITEVSAEKLANDGKYYNLQGMQVSKPQKGIYIQNGKKIVVK
nr:hypothetical protein [uncultured Prevotella sp.]